MGLRFSLKWLLVGMIYAAIVAAAFAQAHWAYADILWAIAFFAVIYSVTLAIFARGPRQGAAVGFAVASLLLIMCLNASPDSLPTARLIAAAMTSPSQGSFPAPVFYPAPPLPGYQSQPTYAPTPAPAYSAPVTIQYRTSAGGNAATVVATSASPYAGPYIDPLQFAARIRSGNAVATLGAGLFGALLGAAAVRRAKCPTAPVILPAHAMADPTRDSGDD